MKTLCLALLLLLALPPKAPAEVASGDFFRIYNPSAGESKPWYINDHCFIRARNGTWHMFGITHQEPAAPLNEINLAHATATNLLQRQWTKQPFALTVARAEPWHEKHLWAPYVLEANGQYYMFYCAGGRSHATYEIHLATSDDLFHWKRHPKNPMIVDGFDARDPFVLNVSNIWIMYYTATSQPQHGNHIVAYATSTNLIDWEKRGAVFTDPSVGDVGGPTESPYVVQRGPKYYLFIGPRGGYDGTDIFVSDNPLHWDSENKAGHVKAHAAEVVQDVDGKWYISRAGWGKGGLYLAPLFWNLTGSQ